MNRCLHITIHEGSGGEPRTTKTGQFGYSRSDPGSDDFMPPLKDPGSDDFMPPLKDPSDTSDHSYSSPRSGGCGTVVSTAGCCCGCSGTAGSATTTPGSAALQTSAGARDYSGFVIVRLAPGIESATAPALWNLADELKLAGLKAVLERPGETEGGARVIVSPPVVVSPAPPPPGTLVSRPLVELVARTDGDVKPLLARSESFKTLQKLEARTVFTVFPPRHSLNSYWRVDLRPYPGFVEEVVQRLNRLAEVDLAYRELSAVDPADGLAGKLLLDDQGYLDDAPVGIGASWAWKRLASLLAARTGQATQRQQITLAPPGTQLAPPKLVICDLEQGWTTDHLDLVPLGLNKPINLVYGANRAPAEGSTGDHGTAVLGQVAAAGNSPFGIRGAATDIAEILLASHYRSKKETETINTVVTPHPFAGTNGHVAAAIVQALSALPPFQPRNDGHILLLEVQRSYLPTEVDEADFDALRLASGLGVLVVEAAGNGGFDLDAWVDPVTHRTLRRGDGAFRDSGAVVVGAARAALPHDRASFSNYGSRLDCFAWGEAVTTCGFGDLAGTGAKDAYTNKFNGTSSASPIIVGAAALLQTLHKTATGGTLSPQAMRSLLADPATGTRQGPGVPGAIGVMPDLEAILRRTLQIVPAVYQRRALGDDGSVPGAADEISSSPDIFAWNGDLAATKARYEGTQGALRDNVPAPGDPAATLITPERWIPVPAPPNGFAGLPVNPVPQGGTPVVAGPFAWTPPVSTVAAWSFLAVLRRPDEGPAAANPPFFDWATGLPPGGPYFRWEEFRTFLRRPGVAWRNAHRVTAANPVLPFVIAGTPESVHVFDFEVIQRLPDGVTVTLQVPPALAAKLRQRQPWLGGSGNPPNLPARPSLKIRGVELAAGTYADATFTVQGTGLQAGHSLSIRQLWRGEVVGGITWFFGPEP